MNRHFALAVLIVLTFGMSGCISSETLIKLRSDGSGFLIQRTLINSEIAAQLQAMMAEMAEQIGGGQNTTQPKSPEIFSEREARARAERMGAGVTFVSSRKIEAEDMQGLEATYAFRDVTELRLNQKPNVPAVPGLTEAPGSNGGETTFRFSKLPNGHSLVTAVLSRERSIRSDTASAETASTQESDRMHDAKDVEQLKKLLANLRLSIAIEIEGEVIKTNSLYRNGQNITLVDLNFSELMANADALAKLSALKGRSLDELEDLVRGLSGFKLNPEPMVTIEFAE